MNVSTSDSQLDYAPSPGVAGLCGEFRFFWKVEDVGGDWNDNNEYDHDK
jgi:hypothetical protein